MMIGSRSRGFFPVLLCVISGVLAQQNGGSYECKPNPWIYGDKFTITFRISGISYPSLCTAPTGPKDGKPEFLSSSDNQNYSPNCTVADDIRTTGACSFTSGTLGCGCTSSNDSGFYVIEYNFIAHPDYDRLWQADIVCFDGGSGGPAIVFPGPCNITDPTTTPPPTAPQKTCDFCQFSDCDDTGGRGGCIALICICGGIIIICACVIVCYIVFRERTEGKLGFIYIRIDSCLGKTNPGPNTTSAKQDDHNEANAGLTTSVHKPADGSGNGHGKDPTQQDGGKNDNGSNKVDAKPKSTKRSKQSAQNTEMSPLKDIPSSPEQGGRSPPDKGSRELPQPSGRKEPSNMTHSITPRDPLPPLRSPAAPSLTSVERDSWHESRKLPDPKEN